MFLKSLKKKNKNKGKGEKLLVLFKHVDDKYVKEIRPCSEQTPSHLAAVMCLWAPAALRQPQAGTSTLLQPPAWCELLCGLRDSSLLKTKATKDQRRRRNCRDIVAFFLIARSTKRATFCQAVVWSWEVNKRSRGEGECRHRWACGMAPVALELP